MGLGSLQGSLWFPSGYTPSNEGYDLSLIDKRGTCPLEMLSAMVLHMTHPRHGPTDERCCDEPMSTTYVENAFVAISDENLQGIKIKSNQAMNLLKSYIWMQTSLN